MSAEVGPLEHGSAQVPLTLRPGARMAFGDSPGLWRLQSGAAEVFATPRDTGSGLDARHFICSAMPGDIIASPRSAAAGLQVTAYPVGEATLSRVSLGQIAEAEGLTGWIEALGRVAAAVIVDDPASSILVGADDRLIRADPGHSLRAAHGVLLRRVQAGSGRLFGDATASLGPGDWTPLSQAAWIEAGSDGLVLAAEGEGASLDAETAMAALERFQIGALAVLEKGLSARAEAEARRVERATEQSGQVFGHAFSRFAGLLGPASRRQGLGTEADPLQAACAIVVRQLGRPMPEPSAQRRGPEPQHPGTHRPPDPHAGARRRPLRRVVAPGARPHGRL